MKMGKGCIKRLFQLFFLLTIVFVVGFVYEIVAAGNTDPPPNGSYKKTCSSIYYNASADRITSAVCNKMNGKPNTTQMNNAQQCVNNGGDISNCDGTLECTGINLPSGSYKQTCFCCKMTGTTLSCYCRNKKGKAIYTTLRNATDYQSIWNDNGTLKGSN